MPRLMTRGLAGTAPARYKGSVKRKKPAARKSAAAPRRPPRAVGAGSTRLVVPAERQSFEGACHCGAIEFSYVTALPPARWAVRLCQCAFCRSHGARYTSDPAGELQFRFERPEFLRRYRFALRTTDFLICKECGVCVAAVILTGRGAQGVINLNTLRAAPKGVRPGKPESHDGESVEMRRARRAQAWTPVVGPV